MQNLNQLTHFSGVSASASPIDCRSKRRALAEADLRFPIRPGVTHHNRNRARVMLSLRNAPTCVHRRVTLLPLPTTLLSEEPFRARWDVLKDGPPFQSNDRGEQGGRGKVEVHSRSPTDRTLALIRSKHTKTH